MPIKHTHKPDKREGTDHLIPPNIAYSERADCRCSQHRTGDLRDEGYTAVCDLNFALTILDKAEREVLEYYQHDTPDTIEVGGYAKPAIREGVRLTPGYYGDDYIAVLIGEGEWKAYELATRADGERYWKCLETGAALEVANAFVAAREKERQQERQKAAANAA